MQIEIHPNKEILSQTAALKAADILRKTIDRQGSATLVAATGSSQFGFLDLLTKAGGIYWSRTVVFHLDEYIGLLESHPASFRHYLNERLVEKVNPGHVYLIQGDVPNPRVECTRLNHLIHQYPVDVAFLGIGENGHLAFNDPPADFETRDPFIIVNLDDRCRQQQVDEGWFKNLAEVPAQAITMSIRQIMKAGTIICCVPDRRKAQAVHDCFTGRVSPKHPASILRQHENAFVYLDRESASLLK
ncbi:glucosamine-6-phosphate deaminase [bacterium]|nr:glucosamine-6-phosphate deaminase [bacterium]